MKQECNCRITGELNYEIDRLKVELEESKRGWSEHSNICREYERQLAEARAEVEKLKLLSVSNKTYQCNYCGKSQCVVAPLNKEEIRQEAAREILHIISMETMDRPFEQSQAVEIIRQHYILEG